jgi:hypothetical protein
MAKHGGGEERRAPRAAGVDDMCVLWVTAGLGCDGDTIALTAATQPSLEELLLGGIPGLPRVRLHNPFLDIESGEAFLEVGVAVELRRITDDTAHVRVKAAGDVRTSHGAIRATLEGAIGRSAPEIAMVDIDGLDPSPLVSITRLPQRKR